MRPRDGRLLREKLETGFTIAFVFYVFVLVLNLMIYVADIYSAPNLQDLLAVSPQTPWGVVTSFFIHADEVHLLNNMVSLFFFLMFFIASNAFLSEKEVKMRIECALLVIFLVPATLNSFVLVFYPQLKVLGSSGIIYSLEGVVLGFSILNTFELRKILTRVREERLLFWIFSLFNLFIVVGFLLSLSLSIGGMNGVSFWFHTIALCCGLLSGVSYPFWNRWILARRYF